MKATKDSLRHLASLLWTVFGEFGDYECRWNPRSDDGCDLKMISTDGQEFAFDVKLRERVTPQMADDLFARIRAAELAPQVVYLVYAPVISPRVAEIARRYGVSYMDHAGNCHIVNSAAGLLISRTGIPNKSASRKTRRSLTCSHPSQAESSAPCSTRQLTDGRLPNWRNTQMSM